MEEEDFDSESNLQYKVTSLVLNVYTKTSLRSPIVGRYVRGQVIQGANITLAENLTWIQIIDKNKTRGYAIGKDYRGHCFVDPCPEPEPEPENSTLVLKEEYFDAEPNVKYTVITGMVYVYSNRSIGSHIFHRYARGMSFNGFNATVVDNLTWVTLPPMSGKTGYVIGKDYRGQCFLDPCPEPEPEPENSTLEFDWEMEPNARCGNTVSFLQKDFVSSCPAIKKSGCLFLAICYLGGVCTQAEVLNFWQWSVRNGKVRSSDAYIQVGSDSLISDCCRLYGWTRRAGSITSNSARSHWWVVHGGKVVYNSVPGWF